MRKENHKHAQLKYSNIDGPLYSKNILVVGANSQIGSGLIRKLKKESYDVYGTTRKSDINDEKFLFFDLSNPNLDMDFSKYDLVVICAAITDIERCESEPDKCKYINAINTIAVIDKCVESKCFVIFLSTNAVFDGSKPFYKHTDIPRPINKYGEFKLSVEKYIQDLPPNNACILRLTKVISGNNQFIKNWITAGEAGKLINAYSNRFISPVDISDVIDSIFLLINNKQSGVFQLGGSEEISFYEYAKKIFSKKPNFLKMITPTLANDSISDYHSSLKTFLPYHKNSYSFEGADLIAASLLRNVSQGTFIDVGANHPIIQNNTYYFYQKGWCGLAIDGNEHFELLWKDNRPRDIFITGLVSNFTKEVDFSIYPDKTLSTMDSSSIQRYEERYDKGEASKIRITTTTLYELLNTHYKDKEIHLLSIDIEGEELNCLIGANLEYWKPGVIVIETKNLSLCNISANKIVDYLTSFGYRLIAKTPLDAFFIYPLKSYLQWIPKSII
jgi:dTDP-4-dehydrorhamnose reductase